MKEAGRVSARRRGNIRNIGTERVQVQSERVLADRLDHGEPVPQMSSVFAVTS